MKQVIKSLIIIVFITAGIFIFDILLYTAEYVKDTNYYKKINAIYPKWQYLLKTEDIYKFLLDEKKIYKYRKPFNTDSKLKPIYIFGCSFAYGHYLEPDETFCANLAKITKRPVYNFSQNGLSIKEFLYFMQNMKFPKTEEPEYVIYVFIKDHTKRMLSNYCTKFDMTYSSKYVLKDNKLIYKKNFPYSLYMFRKFDVEKADYLYYSDKFKDKNFALLKAHILEIQKEIKKKWKNSKFIILDYDINETDYPLETISKDIQIIKASDLTDKDLKSSEMIRKDLHPSAEAWKILTPLFVERFIQ